MTTQLNYIKPNNCDYTSVTRDIYLLNKEKQNLIKKEIHQQIQ